MSTLIRTSPHVHANAAVLASRNRNHPSAGDGLESPEREQPDSPIEDIGQRKPRNPPIKPDPLPGSSRDYKDSDPPKVDF